VNQFRAGVMRWANPYEMTVVPVPPPPLPPLSCTNWTRLVLLPVLIGRVSSFSPYLLRAQMERAPENVSFY